MNADLERAKELLAKGGHTCVLCKDNMIYTSSKHGVKPLLDWLDEGVDLRGFSAADKVVGRGAALLYVLLGVRAVYADVLSEEARAALERGGIAASWGTCVPRIVNRAGDGYCPIETAVLGIDDAEEALTAIRARLKELMA